MDNTVKIFHVMRVQSLEKELEKQKKIYNLIKHTEDSIVDEAKESIDSLEADINEVKEMLRQNGVRI